MGRLEGSESSTPALAVEGAGTGAGGRAGGHLRVLGSQRAGLKCAGRGGASPRLSSRYKSVC